MNRPSKNLAVVAFILLVVLFLVRGGSPWNQVAGPPKTVEYSTVWNMVSKGEVKSGYFKADKFHFETKKAGRKYVANLDDLYEAGADGRKSGDGIRAQQGKAAQRERSQGDF